MDQSVATPGLTVSDEAAIVIAACTVVYTVGTLLIWWTSYRSVAVLREQLKQLVASSLSTARHSVLDSHRQVMLPVLTNESLLPERRDDADDRPGP